MLADSAIIFLPICYQHLFIPLLYFCNSMTGKLQCAFCEVCIPFSSFYKVNVEDINQLLAYHEVFGKLQNEMAVAAGTATTGAVLQSPGGVKSSCSEVGGAGGSNTATVSTATSPSATAVITAAGTHICDICSKIFPFRYQLIVHRRYHTERKPFTCQVCMSYTNVRKYAQVKECILFAYYCL